MDVSLNHKLIKWYEQILQDWISPDINIQYSDQHLEIRLPNGKKVKLESSKINQGVENPLITLCKVPINSDIAVSEKYVYLITSSLNLLNDLRVEVTSEGVHVYENILKTLFYYLNRAEEIQSKEVDKFGRFPFKNSISYKTHSLQVPVCDIITQIIKEICLFLCPKLDLIKTQFSIISTHDVDIPCKYGISINQSVKSALKDIKSKRVEATISAFLKSHDEYDTFDYIMDKNEEYGNQVFFNFISNPPDRMGVDPSYSLRHKRIRKCLHHILSRGHKIGLHAAGGSFQDSGSLDYQIQNLSNTISDLGSNQCVTHNRFHYLKWSQTTTPNILSHSNIEVDYTLGFAEKIGFRCGTGRSYRPFDIYQNKLLNFKVHPMVAMEVSLFHKNYSNLNHDEACDEISVTMSQIKKYQYPCVILWHNDKLWNPKDRAVFEYLISY